ncbi:hypothetical protein EC968_006564 [Mortierella alpina]|nr:hypothetical protein EC968_006564 [Mortierella alpina]
MTTIGYPYALPTTANVSFQEFLAPQTQYHQPLSDATAFRGRLRTALKEHKHSDRHDLLNVQSALEDYIPLLFGLVAGIDSTELRLTSDVETTWRCTISNLALTTKQPRVKQKSIHYEAIFTLLTLGYVLMDRANECSNAVQKKIQIAIGDIPNYPGFHSGEGASLGFINNSGASSNSTSNNHHHNLSVGGSSLSSPSPSSSLSPGSIGVSSGSVSAAAAQAGSRLLKKTGISSSSSVSSKKSTKSPINTIGEFTDYLNDEDLAGMDHQLTTAADLYCKAAGVFEHVVQEMIPRWNHTAAQESKKVTPESSRPVDVQTSVVSAHVKKAAIKAARAAAAKQSSAAGTASPASSGSKTSYVLLAKLTIGVKEEYERAYGLLKSVKDLNEISSDFRAHVKDAKIYYEALAQTFLGLDAYEAQQYGKAIGFMSTARASFAALAKSSKASTIAYASAFEFRLANEKVFAFEKINDSVTFEPIPAHAALMAVMPSGRDLLSVKKYFAPRPSFGTAATAVDANQSGTGDSVSKLAYALQGAYF